MTVYLLHIEPSYQHAGHYIGFCEEEDPSRRFSRHLSGRGSPLIKAAVAACCKVKVAHYFPGADRTFERKLKNVAALGDGVRNVALGLDHYRFAIPNFQEIWFDSLRECSLHLTRLRMPLRRRNASTKFLSGEDIKTWRISRQFTQPEVAKYLGLTAQAVAKYEERGATKATALALSAIDRGLKPFKPTRADYQAIEQHSRMKSRREKPNEKAGT